MSINRRDFLKGALAGVTLLAAAAPAEARPNNTMPAEAVGLLYDSTLCIGCKACVSACKDANNMPAEFSMDEHYWDSPLDISGKTLNIIKIYKEGTGENKDQEKDGFAFMKVSCLHCVDPSCVSVCPVSAMTKNPVNGIVGYDKEICIGCRYCVVACPFGVPRFQYDTPFPQISKCQLCRHRLAEGKYAACATVCPTGATLFGKVEDLHGEAKRRVALKAGEMSEFPRGNINTHDQSSHTAKAAAYLPKIYGEKEVGGTQMLKLAAVPFDKLGMPTLAEQSNASISETMQHTMYGGLIAPLAFLGALTYAAKRNVKEDEHEE